MSMEREHALSVAEQRVRGWLHARGYQPQLWPLRRDQWSVWQCQITDDTGQPVPAGLGAGKGTDAGGHVGALCEATEHLITEFPPETVVCSAEAVADGLAGDAVAPLLAEQASAAMACATYRPTDGSAANSLLVPLALSRPSYLHDRHPDDEFSYDPLLPYLTNSGTALGLSRDEALLHALNETVERDALSLLLCQLISDDLQITTLEPRSLGRDLSGLLAHVEHVLGEPVSLLDLTTNIGVPTVLAYIPPGPGRQTYGRGLGTSLAEDHAIYRALSELLQLELTAGVANPAEIAPLQELDPLLHRAGMFDLRTHLAQAHTRPHCPTASAGSVADQVTEVHRRIAAAGYRPYHRELTTGGDTIAVVHVLIPGLERIMTVLSGHPAVPGPRGQNVLQGVPT